MIIVRLSGGLGNQLFQYAFGRTISLRANTDLKFDVSQYELPGTATPRNIQLQNFNIDFKEASKIELLVFNPPYRFLTPILNKFSSIARIPERSLEYDSDIFRNNKNQYLSGYWQNEKYFQSIGDILKDDLYFKTTASPKNFPFLNAIGSMNDSVSVHIRRGDYVSNSNIARSHGICGREFYSSAMQLMRVRLQAPHFFIFSDDIHWVRSEFTHENDLTIVDVNGENNAFEDLRLMSNCKHNIIANSTFSWWGAWLNTNADKIVIGPKRWFAHDGLNGQAENIMPSGWLRL